MALMNEAVVSVARRVGVGGGGERAGISRVGMGIVTGITKIQMQANTRGDWGIFSAPGRGETGRGIREIRKTKMKRR